MNLGNSREWIVLLLVGLGLAGMILLASAMIAVAAEPDPGREADRDPVQLRFAPHDTTIEAGTTGRLAIMLDEAITVRTIDVTVAYDTTIIRTTGWEAGRIFTDPGLFLFKGFEEPTLGQWHAYVVVMGSGSHAVGPGEVFTWDFEGVADGVTDVEVSPIPPDPVGIYLSDGNGDWYETVLLPPTRVFVGDASPVPFDLPLPAPELTLWPNPFNPVTTLQLDLSVAGPVDLAVYDLSGRRLRTLHRAYCPAGPTTLIWNGRDDDGQAAPSGLYLFRLETVAGMAAQRGILLK